MNINIFGFHSVFYYYGFQHLIVNMYKYVDDGINNKELVYLCSDNQLYSELKKALNDKCKNMRLISAKDLFEIYQSEGIQGIKHVIHNYADDSINKGYKGLRIIVKSDHLIKEFPCDSFLNIEKELNSLIKDKNVSILCAYNFEDYLKDKKFITDDVMKGSCNNHHHRLYNMKLVNNRKYLE